MTFLEMQQELSDRLGVFDNSVSDDNTKIKRWLNMAQREISGRHNWDWMISKEIIQTVIDYTTGTVSVAAGGTTLTFSAAISTSMTDRWIKMDDENWYEITAHTAATDTATISPAYVGTSALSGSTFQIRKLFYEPSTNLDSIIDMKRTETPGIMLDVSPIEGDMYLPLRWDAGTPYQYIVGQASSTGGLKWSFLYSPDTVLNVYIRGIKRVSDMSANSDESIIPSRWHNAIIDLAAFFGFSNIDDTRATENFQKAELGIASMRDIYRPNMGRHRILRSIDRPNDFGGLWTLPSTYGPNFRV